MIYTGGDTHTDLSTGTLCTVYGGGGGGDEVFFANTRGVFTGVIINIHTNTTGITAPPVYR